MRKGCIAGGRAAGGRYRGSGTFGILMLWSTPLLAGQWQVQPSVSVAETYTDNVALAPAGKEQSDYVSQITPGIRVHGEGARSRLDLDYRLQNLIYANESSHNNSFNELFARGSTELAKDMFFLDGRSSITRQIVDPNGRIGVDNINLGNRATVITYGISPRLNLHLRSYVESSFQVDADRVENRASQIGNADSLNYTAHFGSGPSFRRLLWDLDYHRQDLNRDVGGDTRSASTAGDVRYRLSSTWNFLVLAGYEDNNLTQSTLTRNGGYWSAGLEWKPSRKLSASATGGDRYQTAQIALQPSERTSLQVGYHNREVGLILGDSWDAAIIHRTRRTSFEARYLEENTSTQTLQVTGQQFFLVQDSKGNILIDPVSGQPLVLVQNIFGLTNDEFIRKRGQLSFTLDTGKSHMVVGAFNETRHYLLAKTSEDAFGASASWDWKFALRTHSMVGANWERRDPSGTNDHDDLWSANLSLVQAIARDASASLSYSHITRNSNLPSDNYDENRLTLQLVKRF